MKNNNSLYLEVLNELSQKKKLMKNQSQQLTSAMMTYHFDSRRTKTRIDQLSSNPNKWWGVNTDEIICITYEMEGVKGIRYDKDIKGW